MPNTTFDRMPRQPASQRMPIFAGQRVRMADLVVELVGGDARRVVRRTFAMLAFDDAGRIYVDRFGRQQFALAETALAPAFAVPERKSLVLDAAQFVAKGGTWSPSSRLVSIIDDAALGRHRCRRL